MWRQIEKKRNTGERRMRDRRLIQNTQLVIFKVNIEKVAKLLNSATLAKLFERQIMESATLAKVSGVGRGGAKNEPPITETDHVTQQNNIN